VPKKEGNVHLSELIAELLQGLEEYGDLEVFCTRFPDEHREITTVYCSGDNEVCINS
jgi:hypothetical protein